MLDLKLLRHHPDKVREALQKRNTKLDLTPFEQSEQKRRDLLTKVESLRHHQKMVSDGIAEKKRAQENADLEMAKMRKVAAEIKELDAQLATEEAVLSEFLMEIPNIPHESVPVGASEDDNVLYKTVGTPQEFSFMPEAHWDIGTRLGLFDFERATKLTGARFPLYFGAGARLERALIQFMLDLHTEKHGYTEVLPPFMVNRQTMTGTGQLPKFEEDLFKIEQWDYFLIPTAEVPVTNIYANEILPESQLPVCFTTYTPCFRSEAGSYGKDTRGLIRQHQFNKVELVKFVHPENSYSELEQLLENAQEVLNQLEIPYQVMTLSTGDLGFSSAKTYDIEVWLPSQNMYREISSCSNFEDFQARRCNIRFKREGQKGTEFVHTLNGSGLAVGRTVAAILENYQNEDGSVTIPHALRPYMGQLEKISK